MNRDNLQQLSTIRLKEAQALFESGHFSGSYYLAGYAIECALKACIARSTRQYDFPDRDRVARSYTHNLNSLLNLANLDTELARELTTKPALSQNWRVAQRWNESSRYQLYPQTDAQDMIQSVAGTGGLLAWIAQYW